VDFDDAEHARRLERWEVTPLVAYRIEDWDGPWSVSGTGGLIAVSRRGRFVREERSITTSRTVRHRRSGGAAGVRVTSARRDGDDEGARDSALVNMAMGIAGGRLAVGDDPEERNRKVSAVADRLRAGEYPWTTVTMLVDGTEIEFDVLIVGEAWAAFGNLDDDVRLDLQGEGVPFTRFRLTAYAVEDDEEEHERWSERAERFLMRRGRWVPNFVHGWPTWFGNRKASGLRGVPGDLAYVFSSLVERVTNRS
jgi:hypothetical protein